MNRDARSWGFLRISGENLIPREITTALGCAPTKCFQKGDDITESISAKRTIIADSGVWEINLDETIWDGGMCEDLERQIRSFLKKMSSKKSTWKSLQKEYEIQLFIDVEMDLAEEWGLSKGLMRKLSSRGIELLFTFVCGSAEHENSEGEALH